MKKSQIDSILSKIQKKASAVAKVRTVLPTRVPENTLDDDDEEEYVPVGTKGLIAASQKLLAVNRGIDHTDDRDSLMFKRFMSTDKLLSEGVKLDSGRIRGAIVPLIARHKNLKAIGPFVFDNYMEKFLTGNPLSSPLEEINPLHLLEQSRRSTQMGPGGIGSDQAITTAAQCHDSKTEVFTSSGWKPWPSVTVNDRLACRINGRLEFHYPSRVVAEHFTGTMYGVKSKSVSFLVTPNHRFFTASGSRTKEWRWEEAIKHHRKHRAYLVTSAPCLGSSQDDYFTLPVAVKEYTGDKPRVVPPIEMGDWCEFLGWYMAEGSRYNTKKHHYIVIISQCMEANPDKCDALKALFSRLPFSFKQYGRNFVTGCKSLFLYLDSFGYCRDKYVPEFIFTLKPEYRKRFLDAFAKGDGHTRHSGTVVYSSCSRRMIDDIEKLLILDGKTTSRGKPWSAKNRKGQHSSWMYSVSDLRYSVATTKPSNFYTEQYNGMVYCATVPGNLLLTRRGGRPFWNGNSIRTDQFGFIDPLAGPECLDGASEVLTSTGWIRWRDVQDDAKFACNIDGTIEFHQASYVNRYKFEGELVRAENKNISMRVTPNHRVYYAAEPQKDWSGIQVEFASDIYGERIRIPTMDDRIDLNNNIPDIIIEPSHWSVEPYDDLVYCATVPGSKLLVRGSPETQGFWTGNSERIGIDVRCAWGSKIGSDGKLYQKFYDRRSGKLRWLSPEDLDGLTVKLPD